MPTVLLTMTFGKVNRSDILQFLQEYCYNQIHAIISQDLTGAISLNWSNFFRQDFSETKITRFQVRNWAIISIFLSGKEECSHRGFMANGPTVILRGAKCLRSAEPQWEAITKAVSATSVRLISHLNCASMYTAGPG